MKCPKLCTNWWSRKIQPINEYETSFNPELEHINPKDVAAKIYLFLFGRKGMLNGAPFMPGQNLFDSNANDTVTIVSTSTYDSLNKTICFFASQSFGSTISYILAGEFAKPPGHEFDIRYIKMRDANSDFSIGLQTKNFTEIKNLTPIFWLTIIPTVLQIMLLTAYLFMNTSMKDRTLRAYHDSNTWKESFKLFFAMGAEILLASAIINSIALFCGTPQEAVFNDPSMINVTKVLLAIGLDVLRNGAEKLFTVCQEKNPCCKPNRANEYRLIS